MNCKSGICSMTGFGSGRAESGTIVVEAEVRSVNHRFLDLVMKAPRSYQAFEGAVRSLVGEHISRGRVEITLNRTVVAEGGVQVSFNRPLFDALIRVYREALSGIGETEADVRAGLDILARRDVIEVGEDAQDIQGEQKLVLCALGDALDVLTAMRNNEGKALAADVAKRLESLVQLHADIKNLAALTPAAVKCRLVERLALVAPEIKADSERLLQEAAMIAERVDVTEELVRLQSHFEQFRVIQEVPPCGRKLDFLLQELGREFNTIGSKAQDAKIQALVVEAKAELEKLREQVQNIE